MRKSAEEIRSALRADPNTAKIAAALQMELDDYLKLVVHFATTGQEPQLMVVSDKELQRMGHAPPNVNQMSAFLTEAVAVKMTHETTWSSAKDRPVALSAPSRVAAEVPAGDPALAAELKRKLRRS